MKFLALDASKRHEPFSYRGTDRSKPDYVDYLDISHPINQMWLEYIEKAASLSYGLDDLAELQNVIDQYAKLSPPQQFELVEATENNEPPKVGTKLLGFDLSLLFDYSLLSWGLEICSEHADDRGNATYKIIRPLICLIRNYFKPQLNRWGLFDARDEAQACLDCMMALQKIHPNLWEADEDIFYVVGVWTTSDE